MKTVRLQGKTILITGAAGFIGAFLAKKLLEKVRDIKIIGFDSLNDYYDVSLKEARLEMLKAYPGFIFIKGNLADTHQLRQVFREYQPQIVVNLAAQAGVRYSITNPEAYIESNLQKRFPIFTEKSRWFHTFILTLFAFVNFLAIQPGFINGNFTHFFNFFYRNIQR